MTGEASIGPICGVTVCTPDLAASETAYVRHLGYRVAGRGLVTESQARLWNRPAAAGLRYLTVRPAAADDFEFRFVETTHGAGYRAFASHGWNAAELIVRDVDALAVTLRESPFEILGPPQDLSFTDAIRAMQVRGPGGEVLYLTQFKRQLESLPSPEARCDVDRVFIVIVAGPSLDDLLAFYGSRYGVPEPQRMESRVKAMSEAFGLDPEHRYQIAALPLRGRCYIEADQMPPQARPPAAPAGQLPPGIAVVSFRAAAGSALACAAGPAGELVESVPAG